MTRSCLFKQALAGLALALFVSSVSAEVVFYSGFEYSGGEPTVGTDAANINGSDGQVGVFSGTLPVGESEGVGGTEFVTFQADDNDVSILLDRASANGALAAELSRPVSLQGARVSFALGTTRTQAGSNAKDYWIVGLDSAGETNFHLRINTDNNIRRLNVITNGSDVLDLPTVVGNDANVDLLNCGATGWTTAEIAHLAIMLSTNGYVIDFRRASLAYTTELLGFNGSATNLASVEFRFNGGATQVECAGFFFDDLRVDGSAQGSTGAPGDMAVFRAVTADEAITTADFDHTFDLTVDKGGVAHEMTVGRTNVLCAAGHHLVMYSARFDSTGGSNRSELQSLLRVNGADSPHGWSQGYIRRANGANECLTAGGAIIDVPTNGTPVNLRTYRTDNNAAGLVKRFANVANIQFLKLDDSWDYCRLGLSSDQAGPTTIYDWIPVQYNVEDELDSGSFGHISGSADILLKQAGHYLILANTHIFCSVERAIFKHRLMLDGAEIDGSRTTVYVRGNQNSSQEGAATIGKIIETTTPNQVLGVESVLDVARSASTYKADRTGITIVKLPDHADYIRLDDSGRDNFNPASLTALGWNTEEELDPGGFTHSDTQIEAAKGDGYLFFASMYDDNDSAADRQYFWQRWAINGNATPLSFGQTGRYARDDTGSESVGNWSGLLLNLEQGDYVQTVCEQLAVSGTLSADSKGVQGVRLGSLFEETFPVTAGMKLWLKADAGVQTDGSGNVTNWVDQSGNGYDVSQSNTALTPTTVSGVAGGNPVVRFVTTDYLERTTDALGFSGNPAMTVVSVLVENGGAGNDRYFQVGALTTAGKSIAFCTDSAVRYNNGNETFANDPMSGGFSVGIWTKSAGGDYGEPHFYKDGVERTASSGGGTSTIDLLDERTRVGAGISGTGAVSDQFDGDIAELIIYDRVLTAAEIADLGAYLENKYSVDTAYEGGYSETMDIAFTGYERGTTLTDFPALIVLNEDIDGFDYADFSSAYGYDLQFTDSSGNNVLPHEVEQWGTAIPDPVAAWTFDDGTADDVSGNNHHGSLSNSAAFSTDTVSGQGRALSLNQATMDFVQIEGYKGIAGVAPRTMSAWVKGPDPEDTIISWGVNTGGQKWIMRVDVGNGALRLEVNGGYVVGTTDLTDGDWHHVAVVFEGVDVTYGQLYVDGALETVSSVLEQAINTVSGDDVKIGTGHSSKWYTGLIDDVGIWDVALTPQQVAGLYNRGNPPDLSGELGTPSYVWVKLQSLSKGTIIKANWGNTNITMAHSYTLDGSAWGSEFEGVWHMDNASSLDSTSHGRDTAASGTTRAAAGVVGSAVYYPTSAAWSEATGYKGILQATNRTFSAWIKKEASSDVNASIATWGKNTVGDKFIFRVQSGNVTESKTGNLRVEVNGGYRCGRANVRDGQWHHVACLLTDDGSMNVNETVFYVDGVFHGRDAQQSTGITTLSDRNLRLGGDCWTTAQSLDGWLDDARLANVVRSADWMWAEYQTVANNGGFIEYAYSAPSVTPGDFSHGMKIVFDGYEGAGALTDYTALVRFNENETFKYGDFSSANGWDLRFTDAGGTPLDFEIDEWNVGGESVVWVKIPSLTQGTAIWAYWGSAAHAGSDPSSAYAWDGEHEIVWHLDDPNASDSSWKVRNGVSGGNVSATGLIGTGQEFTDDTLSGLFQRTYPAYTVSIWVKAATGGQVGSCAIFNSGDTGFDFQLDVDGNAPGAYRHQGDDALAKSFGAKTVRPADWVQLVATCDGTTTRLYYQGAEGNSYAANDSVFQHHRLGINRGNSVYFNGVYDEFRVAGTVRSADWISAEYKNVARTDEFISQKGMIAADPATSVAAGSATANGTLVWEDATPTDVKVVWGTSDGGASLGGWNETNSLGSMAVGSTNVALSSLTADTTYYYRFYASNTAATAWSEVVTFRTKIADIDGLVLWVNADAITGLVNGATVDTWYDQSGNNNHLRRQGEDPQYVTGAVNGKPVVRFDGQDDEFFNFTQISDIRTVVMLLKEDVGVTGLRPVLGGLSTLDFHRGTSSNLWSPVYGVPAVTNGHTFLDGAEIDGTVTPIPNSLSLLVLQTTGNVSADTLATDRRYASRTFDGDIAEVMLFNRALSLREINELGVALESKYGLTTTYQDTDINPGDFAYRMKITFDGYTGGTTLENFPALVQFGEHIGGFSYEGLESATGGDLRFTDADGTNALSYEIDQWNTNGYSTVWVQVPELTSTTYIWAYWGSASAASAFPPFNYGESTWDAEFDGVWHMKSDLVDATHNDIDGTGSNVTTAAAVISDGQDFDGFSSAVELNDDSRLEHANGITVEAWMKNDTVVGVQRLFYKNPGYGFGINGTQLRFTTYGVKDYEFNPGLQADTWYHVVAKLNASDNVRFYVDGQYVGNATHTVSGNTGTSVAWIGQPDGQRWSGLLDELRVTGAERSDDWILATYETVANNTAFMTYQPFITADSASSVASTTADLNGTVNFGGTTTVTLCYGTVDQGTTNTGWDVCADLGDKDEGSFFESAGSLVANTTYYFRFFGSNDTVQAWSGVQTFRTAIEGVTGMALWLDADEITGKSNGDSLAMWRDLSGSGRHGVQLVDARKPMYVASALNGKPAVRFASGDTMDLLSAATASGGTLFIVHKQDAFQAALTRVLGGNLNTTQDDQEWALDADGQAIDIFAPVASTTFSINSMQLVPQYFRLWINGEVQDPSTANVTVDAVNAVGYDFEGDVVEVILFDRQLSAGEQNSVGLYFENKYGITTSYGGKTLEPSDFNYHTEIDYGYDKGGVLTNFPVLVKLNDTTVPDFDKSQFVSTAGHDLRFTDEDGTTILNYEVEKLLRDVPVAYYTFESNLVDHSTAGSGYNGFAEGDMTYTNDPAGPSGTALDLTGTNGYVRIPGWKGIQGQRARTISAWIKLPPASPTNAAIMAWGQNVTGEKWVFRVQDNEGVSGAIRQEESSLREVGSTPVNDGSWHHVAVVLHEGAGGYADPVLFVDGQIDFSSYQGGSGGINTDINDGIEVLIGYDHSGNRFKGLIDEVAVWEACLTPEQIAAVYNGGVPLDVSGGLDNDEIVAWVQVPSFTNNCRVHAYWGSASAGNEPPFYAQNSAVWDDTFEAVYHLSSRDAQDKTTFARHCNNSGEVVFTNGIVHVAHDFPGAGYMHHDAINETYPEYSVSVWVKAHRTDLAVNTSCFNPGTTDPDFQFGCDGAGNYEFSGVNGAVESVNFGPVDSNNWVNLVAAADASGGTRLYYNGKRTGTAAGLYNRFIRIDIGANRDRGAKFQGLIDEVRVLNTVASSNHVWASYMMLASNDTFASFSELDGPAPVITNLAPIMVADTNGTFRGELSVSNDTPTYVWVGWGTNSASGWGSWSNVEDFGGNNISGTFSTNIWTLSETQEYFYAFYASNVFGTAYAQPDMVFTTLQSFFYTITPTSTLYGSISPDFPENLGPGTDSSEYTFSADPGFHLTNVMVTDGLTISNLGVVASHTFTNVSTNWTIEAQFGINQYTVTVAQASGGTIAPAGQTLVNYTNDSVVFTIAPSAGYFIQDVLADGASQGPAGTYQFQDVTMNHTLTAVFGSYPYVNFPTNGLAFWIDADKITASDGDRIGAWYDFSPYTGTLYQATLADRPEYKTGIISGKPVVHFDTARLMTNGGLHADWPASNVTVYAVHKVNTPNNCQLYNAQPIEGDNRFMAELPYGGNAKFFHGDFSGGKGVVQTALSDTDPHIWAMRSEYGVQQDMWKDGANVDSDPASDTDDFDPAQSAYTFRLGNGVDGDLAEILIYNEALDFADDARVGYYLQQKYGLSGSYVNPHHCDIAVTVTTDADYPAPGVASSTFTYTLTAANNGPTNATVVVVTNTLPAGVIYVGDDGGGAFSSATGLWSPGAIAYQASESLVVTCRLASGTGDLVLTNVSALASVNETEWNAANDTNTVAFLASHESVIPGDFLRKMKIEFPGYTKAETLTNFPVMVKLHEGLSGFRYQDFASATGGDLRFTTEDGETALGYELEEWDDIGTSYAWVTLRGLEVGSTIWAYWGNTNDMTAPAYTTNGLALRGDFVIAAHLNDGNADDSTVNQYDGGVSNAVEGAGQIAGALSFDGNDDYVNFGDIAEMSTPTTFTASMWFRRRVEGGDSAHGINNVLLSKGHGISNDNIEIGTSTTNIEHYIDDADPDENPGTFAAGIQADTWHHLALVYHDGSYSNEAFWYVDGVLVREMDTESNGGGLVQSAGSPLGLGISRPTTTDTGDFDGLIDEFRLSLTERSSNWVWACVMNQGPGTYGAFVSMDEALGPPVVENLAASGVGRYGATFRGELTSTGGAPTTVWVYYGTNDELDVAAAWENTNSFGIQGVGVLETNITGLAPGTTNYYRLFASNTYGSVWAEPSTNFRTADTNEFSITALATGNGQIVPSGVDYVLLGQDSSNYTFSPALGYRLTNVVVDSVSQGVIANYQFTNVSTDHTIHAYFALDVYDVTVTQEAGGTIAPTTHDPIPYGSTSQVFTITADAGHYIWDVVVDGESQGQIASYQFTNVTNDHAITAQFNAKPSLTVTNGAVLWLSAETLNATNDEKILQWCDLSPHGHDVAQGDPGLAPSFVTNALNGKPALYFDRPAGQFMRRADSLGFSGDPAMSVVNVITGPSGNTYAYLSLGDVEGTAGKIIVFCTDAAVRYSNGNAQYYTANQTGSYSVGMWTRNALDEYQDPKFYKDGLAATRTGQDNNPPNLAGLDDEDTVIGAHRNTSGNIQNTLGGHLVELIVYNRALTAADREKIGRYLAGKYRISSSFGTDLLPDGADDPILFLSAESSINGATNNQPIETWADLSGHFRDVTQANASYQPTYIADALNGLPALRFDATDDRLARGDALGLSGDPAMTVFFVVNGPDEDENRFLQVGTSAGSGGTVLVYGSEVAIRYNNGNLLWHNDRITGGFTIGAITRTASANYNAAKFYYDGRLAASSGGSGSGTLGGLLNEQTWVGAGWSGSGALNHTLEGDLAELIVYDRVLTDTERQTLGNYLMNKYKLYPTVFMVK